jgi:hypothetical protein
MPADVFGTGTDLSQETGGNQEASLSQDLIEPVEDVPTVRNPQLTNPAYFEKAEC